MKIRLNKALADAGVCSRRKADEYIFAGDVQVNGHTAQSPGMRVDTGDVVLFRGEPLIFPDRNLPCWLMLHKPPHVVSTAHDPEGRSTVLDFVPSSWRGRRLYPVGRLDYFSEGLVLLTDDGDLAYRLMHPRWHLPRVYEVRVRSAGDMPVPRLALYAMRQGMSLREWETLAPVDVQMLPGGGPGVLLKMTLFQGVNRQIRRMCRDLDLTILRLKRIKQGPLELGNLPSGTVRPLSCEEVNALRRAVGLYVEPGPRGEMAVSRESD